MWRILLLLLIVLLGAQSPINSFPPGMFANRNDPSVVTYTGPGDVVSGALYWYGLRAYSASFAAGLGNAVRVQRASDSTSSDIKVNSDGSLNIASANSFAGIDATCNASISGTTLTLQTGACSGGTLHVNDTLTGAGITQPAYITNIGSCGSNTSGNTCTLNASQSVGTETITAQVALAVTIWWDQTGNGFSATPPVTAPQLLPSCVNNLPCVVFSGSGWLYTSGFTPTRAQPISSSTVGLRFGNIGSVGVVLRNDNPGINTTLLAWTAANTIAVYAGSASPTASATDNAWHAFQTVLNGASSVINVDNTNTTVSPGTTGWNADVGGGPYVGHDQANENAVAYITETGVWGIAFTVQNRTDLCHSQFTYWGTSTSC